MTNSTKCPRCGNDLPANFPSGVCPACLMQQGLSPSTYNSAAGVGNGGSGRRRSWIPPTPAELAPRFPQLEIVELLGQGGMGAVYKVRQRDLDRWAALKVLPDEVAHDPSFSERFQREARALALLGHQHIVIVYEFGQRDGVFFLLMEYIDGVTLRQAIRARQVTDRDALAIVAQICEALQFAHEEGVVHRDIKPENILIDKRGRVKIADFGLAKLLGRAFEVPTLTGTHQVMGTPVYMAPEQMEGTRGVDHRADIFSLGVVFYELLTGELPLGRFAPPSQKYQLDARLDEVVLRTLEKEPDRRYQHASDVKIDVESIRSQPRIASQPQPTLAAPIVKPVRKRWTWRKRFAVLSLLGGGIFAVFVANVVLAERHRQLVNLADQNRALNNEIARVRTEAQDALAKKREQENKPRNEITSHDPNELNAVVQFTSEGPMLNPKFGIGQIQGPANRDAINRTLSTVHKEFLTIEARHVHRERKHGGQISVIEKFEYDIKELENWFWKTIDSQLPVETQKFLRKELPLFADGNQPLPLASNATAPATNPAYANSGIQDQRKPFEFPTNLRYQQLFGWKQYFSDDDPHARRLDYFPIRVSIMRHGNWYRWTIEISNSPDEGRDPIDQNEKRFFVVDGGYEPELPSGLKRFWQDEESTHPTTPSEQKPELNLTANDTFDEPKYKPRQGFDAEVFPEVESRPRINPVPDPTDLSEYVPQNVGQSDNFDQQIVGRSSAPRDDEPNQVPTWQQDRRRSNPRDDLDLDNIRAEELQPKTLDEEFAELDAAVANSLPWIQIKQQIEEMIRVHRRDGEGMGRIHCKSVELYGGKNLRWHAADVTEHATQGLRYERDLVERSKLYLALGIAAEIHDNDPTSFLESRAEATRWYLKGYAELLPFGLPAIAPELPIVEEVDANHREDDQNEVNPVRIAAEMRRDAQLSQRKQAEFTRTLIERRDAYLSRLKELFGRLHQAHDKEQDARARLKELATEILVEPKVVEKLLEVFLTPIPTY